MSTIRLPLCLRTIVILFFFDALLTGCMAGQESEPDTTSQQNSNACDSNIHAVSCPAGGLEQWLSLPVAARPIFQNEGFAQQALNKETVSLLSQSLLEDHRRQLMSQYEQQWQARNLKINGFNMPFFYHRFGQANKGRRSLFISMHGGGGAPASVNDSQYVNQQHLYDATMNTLEGIYLAPRAPTDASDMWYKDHIDDFFNVIIQLAVMFEGVDPNRVYLMGYSAGGDGVYQLAPRMADRWAAASMMAGHPNSASPYSLANTPFAIHVGGDDTAYDRNLKAQEWGVMLDDLSNANIGLYEHSVKVHKGYGHWMELNDAVALPWMSTFTRNPLPQTVHWQQTTQRRSHFYWVSIPYEKTQDKRPITVEYDVLTNSVNIVDNYASELSIWLNDSMLDLNEDLTIQYQGSVIFKGKLTRRLTHMYESIQRRGDSNVVFSARLSVLNNKSVVVH